MEAAGAAVFMGGVSPWQKRCDVASGCLHFIGEMMWCGQPQFSTSYGLFSHVKNTQLYTQVLESLDWAVRFGGGNRLFR